MLILKKNSFIYFSKSLDYYPLMYKIKSFYINNSLIKKEIWLWPILNNTVEINIYISDY
jgi:hypothetical protein